MNILYLHGLNSKLSEAKNAILERYGKVYAPNINYSRKHLQPIEILHPYPETEFNVITLPLLQIPPQTLSSY